MLNEVIRRIKIQKYNIKIQSGYYKVLFSSDSENEIYAINKYFRGVWASSIIPHVTNISAYHTVIYSTEIENYEEVINGINWTQGEKIFYDYSSGFFYDNSDFFVVSKNLKEWVVVFRKDREDIIFLRPNDIVHNIPISQMIKEPINTQRIYNGYLMLHCSACVIEGKGVVFPAQKGAGKTTVLLGALRHGAKYLGNDSAFLHLHHKDILIDKNPHCLRIADKTIENNQMLKEFFSEPRNCDASKMHAAPLVLNGKYQIVPSALNSICKKDCIQTDCFPLSIIIFPKLDLNRNSCNLFPLTKEEAIEKMKKCILENDHRICWLPFIKQEVLQEAQEKTVSQILDNLPPAYELIYYGEIDSAIGLIKTNLF